MLYNEIIFFFRQIEVPKSAKKLKLSVKCKRLQGTIVSICSYTMFFKNSGQTVVPSKLHSTCNFHLSDGIKYSMRDPICDVSHCALLATLRYKS